MNYTCCSEMMTKGVTVPVDNNIAFVKSFYKKIEQVEGQFFNFIDEAKQKHNCTIDTVIKEIHDEYMEQQITLDDLI